MVVDVSSVEVFFDDGLSVMTAIHFPEEPLSNLSIKAPQLVKVDTLQVSDLHSIWQ